MCEIELSRDVAAALAHMLGRRGTWENFVAQVGEEEARQAYKALAEASGRPELA